MLCPCFNSQICRQWRNLVTLVTTYLSDLPPIKWLVALFSCFTSQVYRQWRGWWTLVMSLLSDLPCHAFDPCHGLPFWSAAHDVALALWLEYFVLGRAAAAGHHTTCITCSKSSASIRPECIAFIVCILVWFYSTKFSWLILIVLLFCDKSHILIKPEKSDQQKISLELFSFFFISMICLIMGLIVRLKGQCHEIFDPRFFRQSITPRPLINTLKYFRILFRIRRAIRPLSLIPLYAA
jgi:hypothetical protein